MRKMDYTIGLEAGRAGQRWTATALTDRAKKRTPEPVRFVDRPEALKFLKGSQSEGYRFSGAELLDPEQRLVKNRYFVIGATESSRSQARTMARATRSGKLET